MKITTDSEINLPENHTSSGKFILWSVARIHSTGSPKFGFTQKYCTKFYNSLKSDLVAFSKNNHAKNKTLFATRLVACEGYCRGILYKIGFNPIGSLDHKICIC
jgi:hypothetical protein